MTTVPVHTNLPIATYAKLHRAALAHDTTVGALVAELVRRALLNASVAQDAPPAPAAPLPVPERPLTKKALEAIAVAERAEARRQKKSEEDARRQARIDARLTLVAKVRELHGERLTDAAIARELGVSQPLINTIRRIELGLPTHFAFGGNREAKP